MSTMTIICCIEKNFYAVEYFRIETIDRVAQFTNGFYQFYNFNNSETSSTNAADLSNCCQFAI